MINHQQSCFSLHSLVDRKIYDLVQINRLQEGVEFGTFLHPVSEGDLVVNWQLLGEIRVEDAQIEVTNQIVDSSLLSCLLTLRE